MPRRRAACLLVRSALVCALIAAHGPARARSDDEDEEEEDRRQRLTEREDKRRPLEPWGVDLAGHPLTFGGEYEGELDGLQREQVGDDVDQPDRLLFEQGLELEAFYSVGPPFSVFVQGRLTQEEDLLRETVDEVSSVFVERGEMWLVSENILGSHLSVEAGRLDYEDDRRWWWDDELDSLRLSYERDDFEIAVALARELFPERSDLGTVDPEQEDVLRLLGEISYDYRPSHAVELFLLAQQDHSPRDQLENVVPARREDDSDARLLWLGARATGLFEVGSTALGYWLDAGWVHGRERLEELEELSTDRLEVDEVVRHDVEGWGLDAGLQGIFVLPLEPRVFAGYAWGSGDESPDSRTDRSYRQTNLQANEAGFGGVERFGSYGFALDPELSNLGIVTAGAGLSLLQSSSLDLVYHYFRQVEPADSLRDARIEAELNGRDRDVGHELDLVLALEEWERFELELIAAGFRAGDAFGPKQGTWSYGGLVVLRFAF
jgi:hypothetical protein